MPSLWYFSTWNRQFCSNCALLLSGLCLFLWISLISWYTPVMDEDEESERGDPCQFRSKPKRILVTQRLQRIHEQCTIAFIEYRWGRKPIWNVYAVWYPLRGYIQLLWSSPIHTLVMFSAMLASKKKDEYWYTASSTERALSKDNALLLWLRYNNDWMKSMVLIRTCYNGETCIIPLKHTRHRTDQNPDPYTSLYKNSTLIGIIDTKRWHSNRPLVHPNTRRNQQVALLYSRKILQWRYTVIMGSNSVKNNG